ncbi:MAG: hypothetical protein R6V06_08250 [Kiritimatiellia bacterium]
MLRNRASKIFYCLAVAIALLSASALCVFCVLYGNLNQDEGWYLYAARCVSEGLYPYEDFFFTQAPLMPWFYSLFADIWNSYGLLGGRIFTTVIGLLSSLCVGAMAARSVSRRYAPEAGLIAFSLVGCNFYHCYFTTIPKTYALTSLLLHSGCLVLTLCFFRKRRSQSMLSRMWALPAGLLIALAAGVRLSIGIVLPVITLGLLFNWRKCGSAFFWFALGGFIGLAAVFAPVLFSTMDEFLFCQSFHVHRGGSGFDPFLALGSLSRVVRAYLIQFLFLAALVLAAVTVGIRNKPLSSEDREDNAYHGEIWPSVWFFAFAAAFAVHICSPHPYDDYQVPVMGLLSVAVAVWSVNLFEDRKTRVLLAVTAVLAVNLCSFSSPLLQDCFVSGQDRFWVIRKQQSDLQELRDAACCVKALADGDDTLLTQDLYLAVECGLKVPRGLEMGPFGYFPELSDEKAAKYHVFNRNGMMNLLASAPCEVAAFSGYGLTIQAPVMTRVPHGEYQLFMKELSRNYDFVQEIPDFGQNNTLLQILKRRKSIAEQ